MSSESPLESPIAGDQAAAASPSQMQTSPLQKLELLSAVFDNLPVAVFVKDASDDFRFILWNKKHEEITGIRKEEALGRTDYDIFIKETAEFFRNVDRLVMSNGELLDVAQEKVESPTVGIRWLHTMKVPVVHPEVELNLLIGISEDITEKKKAEAVLREMGDSLSRKERELLQLNDILRDANEELKATQLQLIQAEKMESVGRLAAGVAHEVKNPLALLLMGVEYLWTDVSPDDPNLPNIIKEMREAIRRADSIIRGLVDFSSSRQLNLMAMNLNPFVEKALLLVRHELMRGNIKVATDLAPDLPKVMIDSAKMEQVMVNLLINAVHAMNRDDASSLEVRTYHKSLTEADKAYDEGARSAYRMRPGDEVVVVEILDSGAGIPEDKVGKIFDPFFTTKATGVGTGLGLTVVRKIVDLHKGTLEIENRQEGGVRAAITLRAYDETEEEGETTPERGGE